MVQLELNADLGEGVGDDAAMLEIVTHASIACGGHAGDIGTMNRAVRLAKAHGVVIGAHPGFVDPETFGRRRLDVPRDDLIAKILGQIATLVGIANAHGARVEYVKLHGALANMTAEDSSLAYAVYRPISERFAHLGILAIDGSAQINAARELGLAVTPEAYADRAYDGPGMLTSRSQPGSVITNSDDVVARCLRLATHGELTTVTGEAFTSEARSICVHGDTPGAVNMAKQVAQALENAGFLGRRTREN